MAANEINMKQILEDLKSFLTKQTENNPKKIKAKIIEKINTTFDELSTRKETIDRQTKAAEAAETIAKQNQKNISSITSESTSLQKTYQNRRRKYMNLRRTLKTRLIEIIETYQS